ncbi:MAG: TonB-dependent receptor [Bacteroidaceae bacterium]|nr:TonB-dependent receptor [Bacteroidaceae bacterium]
MKRICCLLFAFVTLQSWAVGGGADSLHTIGLDEVEVVSTIKETGTMQQQPSSVTIVGQKDLETLHVTSLKGVSNLVPNFFMPDYGSRLTSAIYIRGVGARMNTPAVGLYVDDIPYIDKSAFDFDFCDVERVDVLRGPQSTLYGRNTMGGLVKVYTRNPFVYQGTDIRLGYATRDNNRKVSVNHYNNIGDVFAFSVGGYYMGSDGFFKNDITGRKADDAQVGGGRLRTVWKPNTKLKLDFSASYDYSDEGAYPYYYKCPADGAETVEYPELIGLISNNREHSYRRGLFNTGLNVTYNTKGWALTSVTGFQNIHDDMKMDQDFLYPDIYFMQQKQDINTMSEEFTFKKHIELGEGVKWCPMTGVSGFYQSLGTDAPVAFFEDGIRGLMEDNVNAIFRNLKKEYPKMPDMSMDVTDNDILVKSSMKTPVTSLGLFHSSVFSMGRWNFTLAARMQYEHLTLDYNSATGVTYDFSISMPPYMNKVYAGLSANPVLHGSLSKDYTDILPRFAVQYVFDDDNQLYATVAEGNRSGGYNIQIMSDLAQGEMKNQMITKINDVSGGMMGRYVDVESLMTNIDVENLAYKPEYSWNFELGAKFRKKDWINGSVALFYISTHDQQIARFAESGLGRMMVNAGKSRSMGAEVALNMYDIVRVSYGYTDAKFREYYDGKDDYEGNYVPFMPQHTVNVGVDYPIDLYVHGGNVSFCKLTIGADWNGAGRIYWTEKNDAYQNFYSTLGAHVNMDFHNVSFTLWGKNMTNTGYDSFYFESMNRGFAQRGRPSQYGIDIKFHF